MDEIEEVEESLTEVGCDSRDCIHNKDGKCGLDQITIDLNGYCIDEFRENC